MSSQLQHRLQQFESTPPKDAWHTIEEHLNDPTLSLQERLYNYETTPPVTAWSDLAGTLDKSSIQNAVSIPVYKTKWFRFIAAAMILGVIALGILTFGVSKPSTIIAKQAAIKQEQTHSAAIKTPIATSPTTPDNPTAETIIPIKEESISIPASTSPTENPPTITKRYKVVTKEDGQLVRLSQKAYAVFDCAVKGAAQRNTICKENIQTMQAKMASSLVTPSTDFAGLIDMIKTLEENK